MSAHDLIASIGFAARRRLRQMRELNQLSKMDAQQFADMGVCRTDLTAIAGGASDAKERLEAMAKKLGIPAARLNEEHWRAVDMARSCAACRERKLCRKWQAGEGSRESYRFFCPNATAFDELNSEPFH
ncbi:DUF6455 family protein [Pelagibius sp. Alg239-R121]|uniref:DUF6455 family protein n=1 Tax=Pelagibius sp. Alg239-R121 TaxID=2993448 RepID=UPI0024A75CF5|nr:DUF6455 family protein [Pelagibius sp. Alg239-R121]